MPCGNSHDVLAPDAEQLLDVRDLKEPHLARFTRPKAVVVSESSLIPTKNLVAPPPNVFTHIVKEALPYFYDSEAAATTPDGEFAAGTRVVVLRQDAATCRVVDERGLYVETRYSGLTPIPASVD